MKEIMVKKKKKKKKRRSRSAVHCELPYLRIIPAPSPIGICIDKFIRELYERIRVRNSGRGIFSLDAS